LGEFGIAKDSKAGRRRLEEALEERRRGEEWRHKRRGWHFGGEPLKKELLAAMNERAGEHHDAEERRESDD